MRPSPTPSWSASADTASTSPVAQDGATALRLVDRCDLCWTSGLPDLDGSEVCRRKCGDLRSADHRGPAPAPVSSIVSVLLEMGADDYVVKPFYGLRELVARIRRSVDAAATTPRQLGSTSARWSSTSRTHPGHRRRRGRRSDAKEFDLLARSRAGPERRAQPARHPREVWDVNWYTRITQDPRRASRRSRRVSHRGGSRPSRGVGVQAERP